MAERKTIYAGAGGSVVALDSTTGSELWRTKLKSTQIVTVAVHGDAVLAGAGGELFCLDAATGSLRWRNKLKGLGLGPVIVPGMMAGAVAAIAVLQAAAAVAAGS